MRRMVQSLFVLTVLASAALVLAQPSRADDTPVADPPVVDTLVEQAPVAQATVEVAIRDDRFVDSRITVPAGTTVTWVHKGNNTHTISPLEGDWESGLLNRGDSFSFTFTEPGTYQYLCRQHLLQGMRGVITVE